MGVNPNPIKDSNRSKKRAKRGFKSLEESSRKHKRAYRRMSIACNINGNIYKPGEHVQLNVSGRAGANQWVCTAGGSLKYN